ncbi:MAG: hypothetical protein AMXMBFR49_12280 [Chlorobiota bacterium]|nr:MAG: YbbR-like domain-containing protein [Chlorobiota bacterium]
MKKNLPSIIVSLLLATGAWIFITLSGEFYLNYRIPIAYTNLPSNLVVDNSLPREVDFKLKGSGWKFISLYFSDDNIFTVPVSQDSINSGVNLFSLLDQNTWLSSEFTIIDIYPSRLSIKTEEVDLAVKPVVPDLILEFEEGFGLASKVKITPERIRIKGSAKLTGSIRSLKTQRTTLTGLKEKTVIEVSLDQIDGIEFQPNKVVVEIDVQKIADREIEGVRMTIIDGPRDQEIVLVPDEVSVVVRGGIDRIGAIKPEEIRALLNYSEMIRDSSGTAVPNIVLPDNINFIDVKPGRIRYIIKQN